MLSSRIAGRWLGTLDGAGAVEIVASSLKLAFAIRNEPAPRSLRVAHTAAHAVEAVTMIGLLAADGPLQLRLRRPSLRPVRMAGALAGIGADAFAWLPLPAEWRRPGGVAAAVLGLASGLALLWTVNEIRRGADRLPAPARFHHAGR